MSVELVEYKDCVQPFLIHHSNIRGKLVRLAEVTDTILKKHDYPEVVSHLLAELLVISAMLSANLKGKGILTVQLKGDGPVRFIVVDSTATGTLRGYAEINEGTQEYLESLKPSKAKLSEVLGKGYICITLDQGKEPYQGIVELSETTIMETLQSYFTNSEQSEVVLKVAVGCSRQNGTPSQWRAGGILLQRVPEEGGIQAQDQQESPLEQWQRTCIFTDTVKDSELLDQYLPLQQLLYRLFNEDGVWVNEISEVRAGCRCSRPKITRTLVSFPQEEIQSMAIDGQVSVVCQFCNTKEIFTLDELASLYASAVEPD